VEVKSYDDGQELVAGVLYDVESGVEAEPVGEEPAAVLRMERACRWDASYAIAYTSVETVDVTGAAAHSRHHPHRVLMWTGPTRLVLDAEPMMITASSVQRSPHAGTVREGDLVVLNFPDGVDRRCRVRRRQAADPVLELEEGQSEPDVSWLPEAVVHAMDENQARQLLTRIVQVLEYSADGTPGCGWGPDVTMALSRVFASEGVRFTDSQV